ncbi:MAG: hypothetical protein ACO1QB_00780 [Verrucomicrobiales bacterium]
MGIFYTNYTLRGPSPQQVAKFLAGRSAIVAPIQNECVVVFDGESESQDSGVINSLATHLSTNLECPVLAILNHDDSILWYQLVVNGVVVDEYDSAPSYFEPTAEPSGPAGGDTQKLYKAFGVSNHDEVNAVLRKASFDEEGYTFAFERHMALIQALGLPDFGVGRGFDAISSGDLPEGHHSTDFLPVG